MQKELSLPGARRAEIDGVRMTDDNLKGALEIAKADAKEAADALENLVEGIKAVKRILEHPIDSEKSDKSADMSPDSKLVSKLSKNLVGVLGSELIGLLNAAQMAKGHARLCFEDDTHVIHELHCAKEFALSLNDRVHRVETSNLQLKAEKRLLVKEVRELRADRRLLVQEVKSLRKIIQRTKQFDAWRLLKDHVRDATTVHESVLNNKTFKSRFAGIDPPGAKVTKDVDDQDRNNYNRSEHDSARASYSSEKENNVRYSYSPRKESHEYEAIDTSNDMVVLYGMRKNKPTACISNSKSKQKPASNLSPLKQRGLSFKTGISSSLSTGLGRFKNALQEASDQMRHHENVKKDHSQAIAGRQPQQRQQVSTPQPKEQKNADGSSVKSNGNCSATVKTRKAGENSKLLDDEATKSTRSCSFETAAMVNCSDLNTSLNLSTSMISCSDDEIRNDLALQISIDEGSSFLKSGCSLIITPESSPSLGQSTKVFLKPICDQNVLRTLAIPNTNSMGDLKATAPFLRPRPSSFLVGPVGQ